jgi:hypothetical protein
MSKNFERPPLTHASGTPVTDNLNIQTAGPRGPALLHDVWLIEKLAHFHREVIPERRMHAKGSGAHGTFTVTHDITRFQGADGRRRVDLLASLSGGRSRGPPGNERAQHLIALGPSNGEKDDGHHDGVDDVAVQREEPREEGAATDCCEKQCAKARRLWHQKQDRADDFQRSGEKAKPLAESDGIELSDHCRGTVELCTAGSNESKPEEDFQKPKSNDFGTAGGCGCGQ